MRFFSFDCSTSTFSYGFALILGVVFDLGGKFFGAVRFDGQLKCLGGVLHVSITFVSQFDTTNPTIVSGVLNSICIWAWSVRISSIELLLGNGSTSIEWLLVRLVTECDWTSFRPLEHACLDDVAGTGGTSWVGEPLRGGKGGGAVAGTTTVPKGLRRTNLGLLPGEIIGLEEC